MDASKNTAMNPQLMKETYHIICYRIMKLQGHTKINEIICLCSHITMMVLLYCSVWATNWYYYEEDVLKCHLYIGNTILII